MVEERKGGTDVQPEEDGLELDADESRELQEVFSSIFPQYLEPLEELTNQLIEGPVSGDILDGLSAATTPLLQAAQSVGVPRLTEALTDFQRVVRESGQGDEPAERQRDLLIDAYYRVKEAVHELGGAGSAAKEPVETSRATGFVAQLRSVEGIGAEQVQRILAAGLTRPEHLAEAAADEIAAVTGLPAVLAERLRADFAPERAAAHGVAEARPAPAGDALDVDQRLALITTVQRRLELEHELDERTREATALRKRQEELTQSVARARHLLDRARRALTAERSHAATVASDIDRLGQELADLTELTGSSEERDLRELHTRLRRLRQRANEQLREK